ncbi:response regulator transcription factor [Candidatus Saccharibacteria bacterium]|nr:response regulator transcription factor [Candidatus Saccharibacteria bacterium]NCU40682.1 response regulator transcription factor [Candidatus Saccharibacteria bacterium]
MQENSTVIKSILIIEDDMFIGEMYVSSLKKAGYDVDWVTTGTTGYSMAIARQYDLILLDIMLPEKQGGDVLNLLRNDSVDNIPNSRVIILTNFDQDEKIRANQEAKVDGYLIKADITPHRLIEIVQQLKKQ